jgi:Uma2 family endonuclease
VWIVDLAGFAVEVFREPGQGRYRTSERRTSGALAPLLVPGVTIDVAAVFA